MALLRSQEYEGFGPTFARDKIEERQGFCLSSETIRKWMLKEGLWIPKKRKKAEFINKDNVEASLESLSKEMDQGMLGLKITVLSVLW